MRKLLVPVAGALLLAGALSPVAAVERGGELTFGRYADSLFLDPVLNDANVDIWIFTNLYDTLIRSSLTARAWSRASRPSGRSRTTAPRSP